MSTIEPESKPQKQKVVTKECDSEVKGQKVDVCLKCLECAERRAYKKV